MLGAEPSKLAMGRSPMPPRIGVAIGCLCYRSSEQLLRLIRKVMQCQLCAVRNIYEHMRSSQAFKSQNPRCPLQLLQGRLLS